MCKGGPATQMELEPIAKTILDKHFLPLSLQVASKMGMPRGLCGCPPNNMSEKKRKEKKRVVTWMLLRVLYSNVNEDK